MLHRPESLGEAVGLLSSDADARPLAGGASLVAMLNARLVEPSALVSLARLKELHGITVLADGTLRIGAMTRHREVAEISALAGPRDVLRQAAAPSPIRRSAPWGRSAARSRSTIRARIIRRSCWRCRRRWKSSDRPARVGSAPPTISSTGTRPRWRPESWSRRSICRRLRRRRRLSQARACCRRLRDRQRRGNGADWRSGSRGDRRLRTPTALAR